MYSNFNTMVDTVASSMLGVTLVERLPARNSMEVEEHLRQDVEDKEQFALSDCEPLPF